MIGGFATSSLANNGTGLNVKVGEGNITFMQPTTERAIYTDNYGNSYELNHSLDWMKNIPNMDSQESGAGNLIPEYNPYD